MTSNTDEQIKAAYRAMAERARYRPMAPGDGLGTVTVPEDQLDLEEEARNFTAEWNRQEDLGTFEIGLANFPHRPAMIYAVEAAGQLCGTASALPHALELLRMATEEVEKLLAERED